MNDESTTVLRGQLERAVAGDAEARQRLLELTRDRLMCHARRFLHGRYARLEPLAQTDDVVQQLYVKILQNQDRFWVNAQGEPVRSLAEFFGHTSAWMRDVLCDQLRQAYGRADNRPAVLLLSGGPGADVFEYDWAKRKKWVIWPLVYVGEIYNRDAHADFSAAGGDWGE